MFGEFQKLQKICNKMSTRIFKIDGEMPEIIEPKVGNPKNSTNPNWANLSQPWNLTFLKDEILKLFFQSYVPKVPEWKIAHIEWSKKAQNIRKSPKNKRFRGTYCIPPFWEHPVSKGRWVCGGGGETVCGGYELAAGRRCNGPYLSADRR